MAERSGSAGTDSSGVRSDSGSEDLTGDSRSTDGADPTAVFDLLADETRLAIVRELAVERYANWQWSGKTFAELRRAVGVADAGNFSYHLEKLTGRLVAKDGDEYYLLNHGLQIVGAVESGRYSDTGEVVRGETSYDCPYPDCQRALEGVYEDQYFRLRCPDHHRFAATILPPIVAAEHSPDELVEITTLDTRQDIQRARAGVCPNCWGPTDATLPVEEPTMPSQIEADLPEDTVLAAFDCRQCGLSFEVPPGACVVDHPAVVAFYEDHGEPLRGRPHIDLPFCGLASAALESTGPVRVRIDVPLDDDCLSLWLDSETNVVEYERECE
ncbi:winged helix-turn-helix domain-containing protein [Halosimplex salinum]|uniref:winged helix-turn-helix domain-containing protein n=1 Tax=Halosimplex salinum TaxID=1710538 RepID=UPI000F491838|nr:winged helix-turn-helix domain-containing protein [Halosimplex salinum]